VLLCTRLATKCHMNLLNRLYSWYGKRIVIISLVLIVTLSLAGFFLHFTLSTPPDEVSSENLPLVTVRSVRELMANSSFTVTGTVRAVSEAQLQTEAGGRVVSVPVQLGDTVRAGAVIATLENSAQRAVLLQAEGAYEAAIAGAASSESGTQSAETALSSAYSSAINTYRSAFITADSSIRSTIDDLFSNPTSATPGFRLDGFGRAVSLNSERKAFEPIIQEWGQLVNTTNTTSVVDDLSDARQILERLSRFTEELAAIVSRQDISTSFTDSQKKALQAEFLSVRASLNQALLAVEGAQTSITSAKEALTRAHIAGGGSRVSLADAQIKSALGSLRAAQSSYEKTIVRSPIAGVINALYLKTGDYVSPSMPAAIVANNNALEITTYVTELESTRLRPGDATRINGSIEGRIGRIAPALDASTGKVEVRIQTETAALTNGAVVTVEFIESAQTFNDSQAAHEIITPISALKVETDRIVVFTVTAEGALQAHPIIEGPLMGDGIIISAGITPDMEIVIDARGLNEGDAVEIAS